MAQKKEKIVCFSIDVDIYKELVKLAKKDDRNVSSYLRILVKRELSKNSKSAD